MAEAFKQLLCFFLDGTDLHLTYFDHLVSDTGYASTIETDPGDMVSSHQMKRFLKGFSFCRNFLFRRLLQDLFLWRLKARKPRVVLLDLDTMVMDNDDAQHREGVDPTYKKRKGFQPLRAEVGTARGRCGVQTRQETLQPRQDSHTYDNSHRRQDQERV